MYNQKNNARYQALRDISEYLRNLNVHSNGSNEIWYTTLSFLDTKEQRRLNRILGLHKINKFKK